MKNNIAGLFALLCLFLSSCHRPVALFQPSPHPVAARLTGKPATTNLVVSASDSAAPTSESIAVVLLPSRLPVASRSSHPMPETGSQRVENRLHRMQSLLNEPANYQPEQQPQPKPKPAKKLKLGNQIRQGLGMRLRPELNWWQRISWKLKASVFIILLAVVFAILHVTILAIIFGIVGAFLLLSGLKKSFKVKRPWF